MNTANQVDQLVQQLKNDGIPLSDAVWQTALACVGWPYVYAAWGEYCTPANRKRRAREDHPTIVSKCQVLNGSKANCNGCKWLPDGQNVRCYDCRGFTDWCLKQFGIDLKGEGATSQWNSDNWAAKGTIDTIPDDILVCLFYPKKDNPKVMEHTGLGYKGETCECSSGVQHFTKRNKKWTHWAIPKGIDGDIPVPETRPTLRKGSTGPYVVECQNDLLQLGYDLSPYGADEKYGNKTMAAVRAFQADHPPLVQDGICGPATWAALDQAVGPQPEPAPVTYYTVTIPHLTKADAEKLVAQYPRAKMTAEDGE